MTLKSEMKIARLNQDVTWVGPSVKEIMWQYNEIFAHGCYDAIELPDAPFVVDVGANVGLFILFIKQRRAAAEVLGFEPMPESATALARNIELLGLTRVDLHECALGSAEESDVPFTYYPLLPGNSTRFPEQKELQKRVLYDYEPMEYVDRLHSGYEVRADVRRLSSFLAPDRTVDLLKVDVEGGELDVLLGIDPPHWTLIDQVIVEVQDLGGRLEDTCDLLVQQGLQATVMHAPLIPKEVLTYVVHACRL
jgi:FkbM family methyltransferase